MSPRPAWNLWLAYYWVGDDLRVALVLAPHKPTVESTAYRWQINRDSYHSSIWHKHFERTGVTCNVHRLRLVAQVPPDKHVTLYTVLVKDVCVANAFNFHERENYGPRVWAIDALDALTKASVIELDGLAAAKEASHREELLGRLIDEGFDACRQHGRADDSLLLRSWTCDVDVQKSGQFKERSRSPFRVIRDAIRARSRSPHVRSQSSGFVLAGRKRFASV
ncbi:hypothetical protein HDZ31DRAFT_68989 [Schizophyllum fasciatum]